MYHLAIAADTLAKKIILVGDPARVDLVASFFDTVLHASHHREFTAKSGMYKGKHITVMSTGIGTDKIDITLNELDACVNIDLVNRVDVENPTSLEIVRIGTCGILQKEVPLFSYILSSYAYGFDNVAHFYNLSSESSQVKAMKESLDAHISDVFPLQLIKPYITTPDDDLRDKLTSDKTVTGLTITSSGFYGPQGRALRLKTRTRNLNEQLMSFAYSVPATATTASAAAWSDEGGKSSQDHTHTPPLSPPPPTEDKDVTVRVMNYEMETSALFALGKGMGHRCASICLGIANRAAGKFATDTELAVNMSSLVEYVLDRI